MRNGRAEPLLQLRTQVNAARELDRLSHLSGHILQDDLQEDPAPPVSEFGLGDAGPLSAALRRIQMETGEESLGDLRPYSTCRYIHPDKEHLFFFVYSCEFPADFQLPRQAEMHSVTVQEQLSIRENQVLRMALLLCEFPPMRGRIRAAAFEVATLNLVLHDHAELAQRLANAAAASGTAEIARVTSEVRLLEEQTRQPWSGLEREAVLQGLPGLQYREFFTLLLPAYERVGVPGAAEHLRMINSDESKRLAVDRLSQLYHDESIMESIPLEL